MTKVTTTSILGNKNVAETKTTLNQNFELLADAINSLLLYLDPEVKEITNIKSINITTSDKPVTDTLINTNGSANIGGNVIIGRLMQARSATIEDNLLINNGSLTLNSENSILTCNGKFILGGELVMSDFNSSAIINASYVQTWETSSFSNLIVETQTGIYVKKDPSITGTIVGGLLNLVGRSGVIIDWSSYGSDQQHMLDVIMLDTTGITAGHRLTVIAKLGNNSGSHTFKIAPETIAYPSGRVLDSINFTQTYDTAEFIFDGVNWIPISLKGAVLNYTT